jgi:hypothetical protein
MRELLDSEEFSMYREEWDWMRFSVGGLPKGITALQSLQHLRLEECVMAPLTSGIKRLTQLTSLEIVCDQLVEQESYEPEPVAVRRLHATNLPASSIPAVQCCRC